jgi:DNA-binding NarL/FixJ family response regulator
MTSWGVRLTKREQDVLALKEQGLSDCEAAIKLRVDRRTVGNHIQHVMEKLDCRDRIQLGMMLERERERANLGTRS